MDYDKDSKNAEKNPYNIKNWLEPYMVIAFFIFLISLVTMVPLLLKSHRNNVELNQQVLAQNALISESVKSQALINNFMTSDDLLIKTMELNDKVTLLKRWANQQNMQVVSSDTSIDLSEQVSQSECDLFVQNISSSITYDGYELLINGIKVNFNKFEKVSPEISHLMCNQPMNTVLKNYMVVNGYVIVALGDEIKNLLVNNPSSQDNSTNIPVAATQSDDSNPKITITINNGESNDEDDNGCASQ